MANAAQIQRHVLPEPDVAARCVAEWLLERALAVEGKPAIGHPPWEDYEPVSSERATWQRLDDPPLLPDGRLAEKAYGRPAGGGRGTYVSFPVPGRPELATLIARAASRAGALWAAHRGLS